MLIGYLHHRKDPLKSRKLYAYAAVSLMEGAELVYFSPKMVDLTNKVINGYMYKNGKWEKTVTKLPDVIINAGSPIKLKHRKVVKQLKQLVPFTTHSIGNKLAVYRRLYKDGTYKDYLIPSHLIKQVNDVFIYLERYGKVVFKPTNGHQGKNIVFIEKLENMYRVKIDTNRQLYSKEELVNLIDTRMKEENYLIQPYIKSTTKTGLAFDFRIHTQKDGEGKWVICAIYPRIAKKDSVVANINNGGFTCTLDSFLKTEFGDKAETIKHKLIEFGLGVSKKLEELQLKEYGEYLDELGIDVGMDEKEKIWVFEINYRPGCPPIFYLELDVVKNMIRYAKYLAQRR